MLRAVVAMFVLGCGGASKPAPVANTATQGSAVDDREAVEDTAVLVRSLAFEAFPSWVANHPDLECPTTIADLGGATKDAWGTDLQMICGTGMPAGATGIAIRSAGPDLKLDTSDDVKSWE